MARIILNDGDQIDIFRTALNDNMTELYNGNDTVTFDLSEQNVDILNQITDLATQIAAIEGVEGGSSLVDVVTESIADRDADFNIWKAGQVVVTIDDAGVHTRNDDNNGWITRTAIRYEVLTTKQGSIYVSTGSNIIVPMDVDMADFGAEGGSRLSKITEAIDRSTFRVEGITVDDIGKELYIQRGGRWHLREYDFYNHKGIILNVVGDIVTIDTPMPTATMGSYENSIFYDSRNAGANTNCRVDYIDGQGNTTFYEYVNQEEQTGVRLPTAIKELISFKVDGVTKTAELMINNDNYRWMDITKYLNNFESTGSYDFKYAKADVVSHQYEVTRYVTNFFVNEDIHSIIEDVDGTRFKIIGHKNNGNTAIVVPDGGWSAHFNENGAVTTISGTAPNNWLPQLMKYSPVGVYIHNMKPDIEGNNTTVRIFDNGDVTDNTSIVSYNEAEDRFDINIANGITQRDSIRYPLQDLPYVHAIELASNGAYYITNTDVAVGDTISFSGGEMGTRSIGLRNFIAERGFQYCVIGLSETEHINRGFRIGEGRNVRFDEDYKSDGVVEFFPATQVIGNGSLDLRYKVNNNLVDVAKGAVNTNKAFVCIGTRTRLNLVNDTRTITDKWGGIDTYGGTSKFYTHEIINSVSNVTITDSNGVIRTVKHSDVASDNDVTAITNVSGNTWRFTISGTHNYIVGDIVYVDQADSLNFSDGNYVIQAVSGQDIDFTFENTPTMPADISHPRYSISVESGEQVAVNIPGGNHRPKSGETLNVTYEASNVTLISHKWVKGSSILKLDKYDNIRSGDKIVVGDSNDGSYLTNRPTYKKGEIITVKNVYSDHITITGTLYDTYDSNTAHVFLLNESRKRKTVLKDITVRGYEESGIKGNLLMVHNLVGFEIEGVRASKFRFKGFGLESCEGVKINKCEIHQYQDDATEFQQRITTLHYFTGDRGDGTSYGVSLGSCQNVAISNSTLNGDRHSVTFSVCSSHAHYCVNREVRVFNCNLEANYSNAIDGHGPMEFNHIHNCVVDGGMMVAGDNNKYSDLHVRFGGLEYVGTGSIVVIREIKGTNHTISNCTFEMMGKRFEERLFMDFAMNNVVHDSEGTFIFDNCTFIDALTPEVARVGTQAMMAIQHTGAQLGKQNYNYIFRNCKWTTTDNNQNGFKFFGAANENLLINELHFENCEFDGFQMQISKTRRLYMKNVEFKNCLGSALTLQDGGHDIRIHMENVNITGSTEEGLYAYGTAHQLKELIIKNCDFSGNSTNPATEDAAGTILYPKETFLRAIDRCIIENTTFGYTNPTTVYTIDATDIDDFQMRGIKYVGISATEDDYNNNIKSSVVFTDHDKLKYVTPTIYTESSANTKVLDADSLDKPIHEFTVANKATGQTFILPDSPRDGKEMEFLTGIALNTDKFMTYKCADANQWANDTLFWDLGSQPNYIFNDGRMYEITSGTSKKVDVSGSRVKSAGAVFNHLALFGSTGIVEGGSQFGLPIGIVLRLGDRVRVQWDNGGGSHNYLANDEWEVVEIINSQDGVLAPVGHSRTFPTGSVSGQDHREIFHVQSGETCTIYRPYSAGVTGSATPAPTAEDNTTITDGQLTYRYSKHLSIDGQLQLQSNTLGEVKRMIYDEDLAIWLEM